MANLRAYIANCLIGGESITRHGEKSICDTVQFTCENRVFVLTQKADAIQKPRSYFEGSFSATTEILVPNVENADVELVLAIIDRICWLLSLACMSKVVCYGHDYPDGKNSTRKAVVGVTRSNRSTIQIQLGAKVREFVDQTYPAFALLEHRRKLAVAFDYMLQADALGLPTECRSIFASVLLENLKHHYAANEGLPFIDGYFRKKPERKAETWKFRELLTKMFKEVGMTPDISSIISLRNDVVHTGLSALSHHDQRAVYDQIQDLVREYFLRLLGFKGSYLVYSTGCSTHAAI
ncbi:hypothetical protein [Simplicispira metamorpha]|uniref:Apea-like HEPN domain-containing protein n=1 Tax=Simplicispira metamorpha TaxID=80881 RepID=A0A4R2NC94_9BURK|nr:hypothetical protein [Simplicispira metamorpha]TCP18720.1 hypothetical protein EV674_10893 [Simplicispira metamorpha]